MRVRRWVARLLDPGHSVTSYRDADVQSFTVFPVENSHMLTVAKMVDVQDAYFNLQAPITIEDGVVFGHQVMLATGMHEVTEAGVNRATGARGPIVVRRNAWLASRALILGGVEIGEGAAIGAGSVVTESVPAHEFWAGSPARFIRNLRDEPIVQNRESQENE